MDPRHTDAEDEQFLLNMIGEGQGDVPEQADDGSNTDITGELEKLRGHWDAFVEYKSSELGLQKVQKAKDNASKKVYHHTPG